MDDELEFLQEYQAWVAERKIKPDTSPEAFLIDRAKEQALEKLIQIRDIIEDTRGWGEAEMDAALTEIDVILS